MINLYFKDYLLAQLSYNEKYTYKVCTENLDKLLEEGCPSVYLFLQSGEYENIPSIFLEFEIDDERDDLFEFYGIATTDTPYDKLYKIAQKSTREDGLWISDK